MMEDEDKLAAQFLARQKQTVADDGFSREVMRKISSRTERCNRIWVISCWGIGIVGFFLFGGVAAMQDMLHHAGKEILGLFCGCGSFSGDFLPLAAGLFILSLVYVYDTVMYE